MELIEIISDILIFGGILLIFVVLISFLLSKNEREDERANIKKSYRSILTQNNLHSNMNIEQQAFRNNQTSAYPQIFQLNNYAHRELKIVRKRTVETRDIQDRILNDDGHIKITNGSRTRYTIVNEEINKSNIKAANFYL
ncbi:MAG: hypothetical protein NTX65_14145 [Ignavibacteriales bacterium]|nr:hypothetical protein [Ignavibacteriales bacterium]